MGCGTKNTHGTCCRELTASLRVFQKACMMDVKRRKCV